jgi:hypothetical protein
MEDEMSKFLKTAAAASLMGVLAVGVTVEAAQIRATVPFSFEVNGKTLPTGTYTIDSGMNGAVLVSGARSGAVVLGTHVSAKNASPRLVFNRYGEDYVLREIWTGSDGRKLPESRRERELVAARGGANTASVQKVEIPLL